MRYEDIEEQSPSSAVQASKQASKHHHYGKETISVLSSPWLGVDANEWNLSGHLTNAAVINFSIRLAN